MHTAVAAGKEASTCDSLFDACRCAAGLPDEAYRPIAQIRKARDRVYTACVTPHDYFARRANDGMKPLKQPKA